MEVFRISKCQYISDLSGSGARLYGGRWNSKGFSVLYTASSRSLAALEALAHIPRKNLPTDFCIAAFHLPENISTKTVAVKSLPPGWRSATIHPSLQPIGNAWLKEGKYALLRVPSVIIPEEFNCLINPLHPDVRKIKVKNTLPFVFDERLEPPETME